MTEVRKDLFIGVGFLIAAMILVSFALAVQVQASEGEDDSVSSDTSFGLKVRGDGSVDDDQVGIGAEVQVQAQNQVKLRGDGTVDDSQEGVEEEDNGDDNNGSEQGQANAAEHRSAVANFVQSLLRVADREEGGLGQQVREIAREQEASSERAEQARVHIEERSKLRTFLFGTDYKNLGALRSEVVQTQNRLRQLNQTLAGLVSDDEKLELESQIQAVMEDQVKLEAFIKAQETKISLFGWLTKLFNN